MTNQTPIYLLAFITIQAGELSYPLRRVAENSDGDTDQALNDLHSKLKEEFDGQSDEEGSDDLETPEWKKALWHDGQHTIAITNTHEISKQEYDILKKYL